MASGIFRHSPPPEIFEPDDEWKGLLKAQMGKELEEVILAAKAKVQSDIQNTPTERDSLIEEYRQNLAQLTSGAQGEFDRYVEQERERRRWQSDLGDALVVSQQDIWDQIKAERRSEVLNEDEEEHAGEEELPAGTRSNRRPIPRSISSNSFSSSTAGTSPNGYQRWVPMTPQGDPLPGTSPNRSRLPGISRASEQARPRASSSTATAGPGLAPPTISTSASSSNLWASARQPMPIQTQHLVDPGEEARKTRRMLRDMWEQSGGAHTLVVEEDDFESQRPPNDIDDDDKSDTSSLGRFVTRNEPVGSRYRHDASSSSSSLLSRSFRDSTTAEAIHLMLLKNDLEGALASDTDSITEEAHKNAAEARREMLEAIWRNQEGEGQPSEVDERERELRRQEEEFRRREGEVRARVMERRESRGANGSGGPPQPSALTKTAPNSTHAPTRSLDMRAFQLEQQAIRQRQASGGGNNRLSDGSSGSGSSLGSGSGSGSSFTTSTSTSISTTSSSFSTSSSWRSSSPISTRQNHGHTPLPPPPANWTGPAWQTWGYYRSASAAPAPPTSSVSVPSPSVLSAWQKATNPRASPTLTRDARSSPALNRDARASSVATRDPRASPSITMSRDPRASPSISRDRPGTTGGWHQRSRTLSYSMGGNYMQPPPSSSSHAPMARSTSTHPGGNNAWQQSQTQREKLERFRLEQEILNRGRVRGPTS